MPIAITCPECGHLGRVPESFSGQMVRCPKCSKRFRATARLEALDAMEVLDVIEVVENTLPQLGKATYNTKTDTFSGTLSAVMKLAIQAVHDLGYRIDYANESLGLLTFQTGMTWSSWNGALCSLSFEERGPNTFRAIASVKANQSGGQIFAPDLFGELKGKATIVIKTMTKLARV